MAQRLKYLLILAALLLTPQLAKADSPTIMEQVSKLPIKEGVMYDFAHNRVLNTLAVGVIGWEGIGLDATYIGVDGVGATLNYNLAKLPVQNVPIISYVQYLNVGWTAGWRTLTNKTTDSDPKSDNRFIQGPTVFVKLNF